MKNLRTSILKASRAFKTGAVASKRFATSMKTLKRAVGALLVLETVGFIITRLSDIFGGASKNVQEYAEEIDFTTEIFDKYSARIKAASSDLDELKNIEQEAFSEKDVSDKELKHLDKTARKLQDVIDKYDAYDEFTFEGFAASYTGTVPQLEFDEKQIVDDARRIIGELATITDESGEVITLQMGYMNFANQEKDLRRILAEVNEEIKKQSNENEQLTNSYDKASQALETYSQDIKDYRTDLFASAQKEVDLAGMRKKFSGAELEFEIKKFEAKQKLGKLYLSEDEEKQLKGLIEQKYDYLEAEQNILEIQKAISAGQKKYLDSTKSEYVLLNEQIDNTADLINKIDFSTDEGVEQYDELLDIMGHLRNEMIQLEDIGLDVVDKDEAARITNLFKEVDKLNKSSLSTSTTLMMLRDDLVTLYVALDTAGKNADDLVTAIQELDKEINKALDDEVQTFDEIKTEIENMTLALSDANLETELYNKLVTDKAVLDDTQIEAIKELIKAYIAAKKAAENYKEEIEPDDGFVLLGEDASAGFLADFTNMLASAERIQDVSLKNLRMMWEKTLQEITAKIITSGIIRLIGAILGLIGGDMKAGISAAAVFSQSLGYYHKGGKVKKYHSGGMIPSYHSGGGVEEIPIMAQEGEFVLSRDAVSSIGVENLNRMNRTGQASGGVTVNFSGNVLSKNFIEQEAIPKIKDAIRRGADIGIK